MMGLMQSHMEVSRQQPPQLYSGIVGKHVCYFCHQKLIMMSLSYPQAANQLTLQVI